MKQVLVALVALTGCATVAEPPAPTGPCTVGEPLRMRFIGTEYRSAMRDEIQRASGSRIARVLGPDDAATMDYRDDRLNIHLDEMRRIAGFRCG